MIPDLQPITRDNLSNIQLLARLGQGEFRALAWSRDEKWVAVATTRGIWLHDADDLEIPPKQLWAGEYTVNKVDFSPDSLSIASADSDGLVRIWDVNSRLLVKEIKGHDGAVMSVRFSPDGTRLFSGGSDSLVRVWDAQTWKPITILPCGTTVPDRYAHVEQFQKATRSISNLAFSPDGSVLMACGNKYTNIFFWNTATYTLKTIIDPEQWNVHSFAFTDRGKTLSAHANWEKLGGHIFWDVDTGQEIDSLVMFFPYDLNPPSIGKNNVWAREDDSKESQVVFKNILTGETVAVVKHPDTLLNSDRTRNVTRAYEGSIELWDVNQNERIAQSKVFYQINASGGYGIFSPDSEQFAVGSYYSGGGAYMWDIPAGEALGTIPGSLDWAFGNGGGRIFFRPDGTLVLISCREINNWQHHNIQIWDMLKHIVLAEFTCPKESILDRITNFVISPNWKLLVTGSESGPLRIWNLETGEHHNLWKKPGQKIVWIGFSPDGTHVSIVTDDHMRNNVHNMVARVIDLKTGKEIFSTPGFTANFTPDGTTLLVMSREEKYVTQVWDIRIKQKIGLLPRINSNAWFSFTSDGQAVLIPHYNAVQCWDWQRQQELAWIYLPDANYLADISVSPDGKIIAVILDRTGDVLLYGVPAD